MDCLKPFKEGKIYEVILCSGKNVTPVGIVRNGNTINFKLFPGKSMEELKTGGCAVLQITRDAELLVRLALNIPIKEKTEELKGTTVIRGLPWISGRVRSRGENLEDNLGSTPVLKCEFTPLECSEDVSDSTPISRADLYLLEMGVDVTRLMEAEKRGKKELLIKLRKRIIENYRTYRRLGGNSSVAELIVRIATDNTKP